LPTVADQHYEKRIKKLKNFPEEFGMTIELPTFPLKLTDQPTGRN
jgi:hypothetical protein